MASDYWTSTQHRLWENKHVPTLLSATVSIPATNDLPGDATEQTDLLPKPSHLRLFFHQQLFKLGSRLTVRQVVLATANVYIRRFYLRVAVGNTNPYMMLATAFYLACKIEESPLHIRVIVAEARGLWQDLVSQDTAKLGECEFHLISELNANLIVFHPYNALEELHRKLSLTPEEIGLAWAVVNDHYATDCPLQYPPHVIATTAIVMANAARSGFGASSSVSQLEALRVEAQGKGLTGEGRKIGRISRLLSWLARSDVKIEDIADCMQQMISLYIAWDSYCDKSCKEQIVRLVRESSRSSS